MLSLGGPSALFLHIAAVLPSFPPFTYVCACPSIHPVEAPQPAFGLATHCDIIFWDIVGYTVSCLPT